MRKWIRLICSCGGTVIAVNHKAKKMLKHKEDYPLIDRINYLKKNCQKVCDGGFRVRFVVSGEENIPQGQKLYIGNHTSLIDPVLFLAVNKDPVTFVAKKEIEKYPFVGKIVTSIDPAYLDRGNLRKEIKTYKMIDQQLDDNPELSYLIYPEGTRTKAPDFPLLDFHPGAFKIATKRGMPIVPVAVFLTNRILHQKFHFKVYPIQVRYLTPIYEEEYSKMTASELSEKCRSLLKEATDELRAKEPSLIQSFNNYSDKKMAKVMNIYSKEAKK